MTEAADETDLTALTDDECCSDASDSEFGLSNRQLEDLWQHFLPGDHEVALDRGEELGDGSREHDDADFGLSAQQLASLGRRCSAGEDPLTRGSTDLQWRTTALSGKSVRLQAQRISSPGRASDCRPLVSPTVSPGRASDRATGYSQAASRAGPDARRRCSAPPLMHDPLSQLLNERNSQSAPSSSSGVGVEDPESFIAKQLPTKANAMTDSTRIGKSRTRSAPANHAEPLESLIAEQLSASSSPTTAHTQRLQQQHAQPKVALVSSRDIDGTVWYLIRVCDRGEERFYMKRYSDFKMLDDALRKVPGRSVPDLPEQGLIGLRQFLDIGDFRKRRKEALANYVRELFKSGTSFGSTGLCDETELEAFFGCHAPGRVYPGHVGWTRPAT